MLSCKVGETIINTIDNSDSEIRKLYKKKILKCPVCNGDIVYKNGEFKIAHFAHKANDNCMLKYHEPETEEHLNGKKKIYEILKNNKLIKNLKIEAWIPETKQRPDIYFEFDSKRYVIEYQCSPISTEYSERHLLYKMANINDIWILGTEKYFNEEQEFLLRKNICDFEIFCKTKTLERELFLENKYIYYLGIDSLVKAKEIKCGKFKTKLDVVYDSFNFDKDLDIPLFLKGEIEQLKELSIEFNMEIANTMCRNINSFKGWTKNRYYAEVDFKDDDIYIIVYKGSNIVFKNLFYELNVEGMNKIYNKEQKSYIKRKTRYDNREERAKIKYDMEEKITTQKEYILANKIVSVLNSCVNNISNLEYTLNSRVYNNKYFYEITRDYNRIYNKEAKNITIDNLKLLFEKEIKFINNKNREYNDVHIYFKTLSKNKNISYKTYYGEQILYFYGITKILVNLNRYQLDYHSYKTNEDIYYKINGIEDIKRLIEEEGLLDEIKK